MSFIKQIAKKIITSFPSSAVLMIHHVGDDKLYKRRISSCFVSIDRFIALMDLISEHSGTLSETYLQNGIIGVSFDDGFEEVYSICYPILKSKNIPFTVFVVEDYIGMPGYLSLDQLISLSHDNLVTIGSHGKSHAILSDMSEDCVYDEIVNSKIHLQKRINASIDLFAYSHGQRNKKAKRLVKVYKYAFSANSLLINSITRRNRYYLPRLSVTDELFESSIINVRKVLSYWD